MAKNVGFQSANKDSFWYQWGAQNSKSLVFVDEYLSLIYFFHIKHIVSLIYSPTDELKLYFSH